MKRLAACAVMLVASAQLVFAGEYAFCVLVNQVADGGKLKEYTDKQIENGLCMTSKEVLNAIVNDNPTKEAVCTTATEHMMREFLRRFPGREPSSVIGKC